MALLRMEDWYDLARDTNWTPSYVTENELFPEQWSSTFDIPLEEWEKFDEPYKLSYRDYVKMQRDKDVGAYSVKAALSRRTRREIGGAWRAPRASAIRPRGRRTAPPIASARIRARRARWRSSSPPRTLPRLRTLRARP